MGGKQQLKSALQLAGSQHRYQKTMIALLAIGWVSMMFVFLSSPFLYMDPLFHCEKTGDESIKEKQACETRQQCHPSILSIYLIVDDFTMTSAIELYCDLSWARTTIQSCFPVGSFTGLMVMNLISDIRGRRQAFLISLLVTIGGIGCNFLVIIVLLLGEFIKNPWILMISQFMRGFGAESIMPLCYTMCADFLSDKMRPKAIVMLNSTGQFCMLFSGIVSIVLGFFYIMKLNWFYFVMIFQLAPFIIVFIMFFFYLQQSPYILMEKNERAKAKAVFHYIAKFNKKDEKISQIDKLIDEVKQQDMVKPNVKNVYKTVKQWKYLKTIIILIAVNGIAHMNYLGIAYAFAQVGLGYGYNSMMLGLVQFLSLFFVSYIVSNVPRKIGISGFYLLTMGVGLLYFVPFVSDNKIFSTLLIGISRIFSVSANCLIGCMETEAFTVQIQSTAIGLIEGLGLYGAIVAPFIVLGAQHVGVHPMGAVALFVSLAVWPPHFLTETFKKTKKEPLMYKANEDETIEKTQQNVEANTKESPVSSQVRIKSDQKV